MKFKYYFNYLSLKERVLSFLLIPLILFLLFSLTQRLFLNDYIKIKQKQIKLIKSQIKKSKSNIFKPNDIVTIQFIENIANISNIQILSIEINKSSFNLKTLGNYQNSINFLIYLEQNMETTALKIYNEEPNTIIQGTFKIHTLLTIDNLNIMENIPNPFIQIKHRTKILNNNILQLMAIFDKEVCINNKWYNKGDIIGKYKIVSIFTNHIELIKNGVILKLEVYKNE